MSAIPAIVKGLRADRLPAVGLLMLLSLVISYGLASQDYNILFGVAAVLFAVAMVKARMLPIILVLLIIPFAEWAVEYRYLPHQVMWLPEMLGVLMFAKALALTAIQRRRFKATGAMLALLFLALTFLSILVNRSGVIPALLMLRLLFRYYLLFLAIINLDYDEKSAKLINKILILVFLLQIPLSVVKLFTFGQGETSLGLSSHSLSTIFPLIAIAFLWAYYFLYERRTSYIWLIFAFTGLSIIGGKRAFIFYLPVLLVYMIWTMRKDYRFKPGVLLSGVAILLISMYFSVRLIPTLNAQREIWGEFSLSHLVNYAASYETGVSMSGMPTGRISATIEVYQNLERKGFFGLSLGHGPGVIVKSMFGDYDRKDASISTFGVEYGLTGLSWLAIQVGYLGTAVYLLIFFVMLRLTGACFRSERDAYWRSFALGMMGFSFILLLTSLFYTPFFNDDSISAFYFCLMAVVVLRKASQAAPEAA